MALQNGVSGSTEAVLAEKPINILIIDDDHKDREFCRRLFEMPSNARSYNVVEAENAEDGLSYLAEAHPDCILLDYFLPTDDGIDTLNRIRATQADSSYPIIMITGQGDERVAVEAMKQGVSDYLIKSDLTSKSLEESVNGAIEKAKLHSVIERYQKELERSNRELADFCHTVSHDLKAPLRKISSFCQLLQKNAYGRLDRDGARYIEQLMTDSGRVNSLVQDLLTYSKVMETEEPKEKVELNDLVRDVLSDLEFVMSEQRATVEVLDLPTIIACPLRMQQLFLNLIANAIKFRGDRNPMIRISAEKVGPFWQFRVEDNGIGIETQYLDRIFGAFKRIHSQDEYEGSGIGLSICQKVVEMHGGQIWAESDLGGGSVFNFTLPVIQSEA